MFLEEVAYKTLPAQVNNKLLNIAWFNEWNNAAVKVNRLSALKP